MAKRVNWLSVLAEFVKDHPKTSATVAFNLGVFAAQSSKALGGRARTIGNSAAEIPSKLVELVPSMKELGSYVPLIGNGKPKPRRRSASKTQPKHKAATRKTASRTKRRKAS